MNAVSSLSTSAALLPKVLKVLKVLLGLFEAIPNQGFT
jgi:hypothetical protein